MLHHTNCRSRALPLPLVQITGGRNGYGAKLANIFSTEFTIETCDGARQRRYKQTFTKNMQVRCGAVRCNPVVVPYVASLGTASGQPS